jgi:hypothetical protein
MTPELSALLGQLVTSPRFHSLYQWRQHVDNSRFIVIKWVLTLYDEDDLNSEYPRTKHQEGTLQSVLEWGALELGITPAV